MKGLPVFVNKSEAKNWSSINLVVAKAALFAYRNILLRCYQLTRTNKLAWNNNENLEGKDGLAGAS